MKNKKINIKNIWVYIVMFLLILVIVLPPALRMFIKQDPTANIETPKEKATALICNKQATFGEVSYQMKATTSYVGTDFSKITLQYQRTGLLDQTNMNNEIETEIQTFRNTNNLAFIASDLENGFKFVVTLEKANADPNNLVTAPYFNDLSSQMALFSQLGYTCSQMTS